MPLRPLTKREVVLADVQGSWLLQSTPVSEYPGPRDGHAPREVAGAFYGRLLADLADLHERRQRGERVEPIKVLDFGGYHGQHWDRFLNYDSFFMQHPKARSLLRIYVNSVTPPPRKRLKQVEGHAKRLGTDLRFVTGFVNSLPRVLGERDFDYVVASNTLYGQEREGLGILAGFLKEGGRLYFCNPFNTAHYRALANQLVKNGVSVAYHRRKRGSLEVLHEFERKRKP
jgi:hypothetical protein